MVGVGDGETSRRSYDRATLDANPLLLAGNGGVAAKMLAGGSPLAVC
jgi:hypothetical protein